MNSLVGPSPRTFSSSSGATNTWLDDYIDNPNYGHGSLWDNSQRNEDTTQTRFAGMFTLPELQILSQVVNEIPNDKNKVPDHMLNAPSIKNIIPQTQIPVDYFPGLGIAPTIRKV